MTLDTNPSLEYLQQQLATLQKQNLELRNYIQKLEKKNSQITEFISRDQLTGLNTLNYLYEYLATLKSPESNLSLAIIDIRNFKAINETCTREIGDKVLKAIATILREHFRKSDILVRYGGDQFAVVFPYTHLQDALVGCERFRSRTQYHNWHNIHPTLKVTLHIGLVSGKTNDYEDLLHLANKKLSEAKHNTLNSTRY